jgi:hypothetical protein
MPFAYGLVFTRPQTCTEKRELCVRMGRAMTEAVKFIHGKPDEALALLKKRFARMDQKLLAAAWETVSKAHAKDVKVTLPALEHSQKVSLEAGLLKQSDALTKYDGLFTHDFVPR